MHGPFAVIAGLEAHKPGILVIRNPLDATVSYAIMSGHRLFNCIDYYVCYYRPLLRLRTRIFVSDFAVITVSPRQMLQDFCKFYRIEELAIPDRLGSIALSVIDEKWAQPNGEINSDSIPRPDTRRMARAQQLRKKFKESRLLTGRLREARQIYEQMLG